MTRILALVPVDADVDKTEHVAYEHRPERNQHAEIGTVRDFEFQHYVAMSPSLKSFSLSLPMLSSVHGQLGILLTFPD